MYRSRGGNLIVSPSAPTITSSPKTGGPPLGDQLLASDHRLSAPLRSSHMSSRYTLLRGSAVRHVNTLVASLRRR